MKPKLPARARLRENELDSSWERHVLPSGLTVVLECVPTVSSLALGVWIKTGTREETDDLSGVAHFVEHLVFKGTRKRTTFDIAKSLECVGGELDAFTGRDSTAFYARVMEEHLELAVDVLADLVTAPLLTEAEVEKEKKVVIEEIRSFDDNPEDLVFETFASDMWRGHPLGRPILGTEASIASLRAPRVREWFGQHYTAQNMVISAAGSLDPEVLLRLLDKYFQPPPGAAPRRRAPRPAERPGRGAPGEGRAPAPGVRGAPPRSDPDPKRFAVNVLATALGAGMSSRLFQAVRERESLAYSVFSFADFYREAGVFCSSFGCAPGETQRALDVIRDEYAKMRDQGLEPGELESSCEQMKGGLLLGLESMSNRMSRLARSEMYLGRKVGVEELVECIESVTPSEVHDIAQELLDPDRTLVTALGPEEGLSWNGKGA